MGYPLIEEFKFNGTQTKGVEAKRSLRRIYVHIKEPTTTILQDHNPMDLIKSAMI